MNILVLGSGGREHAFAWKLAQSPQCNKLYVAPGNAGTSIIATNLAIEPTDFKHIGDAILANKIDIVVVGPEAVLVKGIVNYFSKRKEFDNVIIIGPDKAGAQLEGSKDFSKSFMNKYEIPTAKSKTFTIEQYDKALTYLADHTYPLVLKVDGLAEGKGVIIATKYSESKEALDTIFLKKKFKDAGNKIVIEDFLDGIEVSVFILTDGKNYKILPEAKDYKRIGEHDTGLNTGGMGAISPVPFVNNEFLNKVEKKIILPTIKGLGKEGIEYKGFLFIGLMNINGEPFVIEYNIRMGDPETQVVLPRITSDLVELLVATGNKSLDKCTVEISPLTAITVVAVAGGYPSSNYKKGDIIYGIEDNNTDESIIIFHAGVEVSGTLLKTNGGRILAVTALTSSISKSRILAYNRLEVIIWKNIYFRKDIGNDLLPHLS